MSLVNDMLRDLDRRKPAPVHARRIGIIDYGDERSANLATTLLLVVCCVLGGIGGGYLLFNWKDAGTTPAVVQQAAIAPVFIDEVAPLAEPEVQLTVVEEFVNREGFSMRLMANEKFDFEILERSNRSMKLQLTGIDKYAKPDFSLSGMSILQTGANTLVEFELEASTDFQVYEEQQGDSFNIVVTATYRSPQAELARVPAEQETSTASSWARDERIVPVYQAESVPVYDVTSTSSAVTSKVPRGELIRRDLEPTTQLQSQSNKPENRELPVRVNRSLSFEQQDRENSQASINLMQSGRLLEAYEKLLTFVARNPEAHFSRETLGTILLAQKETSQARIIVDEGLALVPNYAPYKKIKARLLMEEGASAEALALLRSVPPTLANDPEYHEILATLYQQGNLHEPAVATYQELLRTNSEQGRWWIGLAISLEAQGNTEKALASFQAALQARNLDASLRQYTQNRIRTLSTVQ